MDQSLVFAAEGRHLHCRASWDFEYLRSSMQRRPWVQLSSHLLDPANPRLGMTPAQILSQDVLVLNDVPVTALDVNQWDAIRALVTDRGGSVILLAGTAFDIADYTHQPIARTLLPFHDIRPIWKEWPGEQPAFHFVPTPQGEREALRLGGGPDDSRRWQELPGVFRYLQIPDKDARSRRAAFAAGIRRGRGGPDSKTDRSGAGVFSRDERNLALAAQGRRARSRPLLAATYPACRRRALRRHPRGPGAGCR